MIMIMIMIKGKTLPSSIQFSLSHLIDAVLGLYAKANATVIGFLVAA